MFVDRVAIRLLAGKGGDGCISFCRSRGVPRGGPDGGDGGEGGSVILLAQDGVDSLATVAQRKIWQAHNGQPGRGKNCHGGNAKNIILEVPAGTLVIDEAEQHVMKDLLVLGDQVCVARGGRGGKGNARFKSATNQAPRTATRGCVGENRWVTLELRMIADVGLVGKPNAGKSTLLSRISRAKPKIAGYPFTTKSPHLGLVRVDQDRAIVVADIPGLIEGAHAGAGLGHEFLRHIERTKILVHLVEPEPIDGSDPVYNFRVVESELREYGIQLGERPRLVVVSKAELTRAAMVRRQLGDEVDEEVLAISSVTGAGIDQLLKRVLTTLHPRRL